MSLYYTPDKKSYKSKKKSHMLSSILKRISNWGHSKLTVMLVPHSEKKIFNFQISNFTLVFTLFLATLLITTSIYAIKIHEKTSKKKIVLENENNKISSKLVNFVELSLELEKKQAKLKKNLVNLIKKSGGHLYKEQHLLHFPPFSMEAYKFIKNGKVEKIEYIEAIYTLQKSIEKIKVLNKRLYEIKMQINGFKKIIKDIPSIWPIYGGDGIYASGYGPRIDPFTRVSSFHPGVDILAMPGHPVRASADGIVEAAEYHHGNGFYVNIRHKYSYVTNYSHLNKFIVSKGDIVKKGQVIGYIGNTGRSTGYHLHYEVRIDANHINPDPFLHLDKFFNK